MTCLLVLCTVPLTVPVYMALSETFLSAHFRVTDSVPAVFLPASVRASSATPVYVPLVCD